MNVYEKGIKSCRNIVGYYDYAQLFPVYGYLANITKWYNGITLFSYKW